jgi:sRNA-binding protein
MPYQMNPILDRLGQAFPAGFNRTAPRPLKIGLGEELMALAGVHPALADLTRTRIRRALKAYTGMPAYRQALARGGPRYDLNGQPAGEVTPDQQADARRPRGRPSPAPAETPASPRPRHPPPAPRRDENAEQALLEAVIAMAIPGKLEVTLKINQLPQAKPASAQTVVFAVQAEGATVVVELKNKMWNHLKTAAETYPQWVAAITGPMGEAVAGGFRLVNPAVQVFEKKPKPNAAAPPVPEPKVTEPKAPEPPTSPAVGYAKMTLKRRV